MAGLAQAADSLNPAERFFDPLALDRADAIARMPSGAAIDCRAAISIILRDVRRATALATAGDKVGGVIVLVTCHRAAGFGVILDHVERRRALGPAVCFGQPRIDDDAVAVLSHQMPHVTALGLF